jgi:hypothetical protein
LKQAQAEFRKIIDEVFQMQKNVLSLNEKVSLINTGIQ